MRILLVSYWCFPNIGGVSSYLLALKRGLELHGHEVEVLARDTEDKHYYLLNSGRSVAKEKIKNPILSQLYAYYSKRLPDLDNMVLWIESERYGFEAAAAYFGLDGYDLIHTQEVVSTVGLARIKPKHVPLVATLHGVLASEWRVRGEISTESPFWRIADAQDYYGAMASDVTIVPSQWLKRIIAREYRIPERQMTVVPYGMDTDAFRKRMEEPVAISAPPDKKVLVCPARLNKEKGHEHLLHALARLKQERTDWVCWVIGDGDLREDLTKLCGRLRLQRQVTFLGHRDDIPALLKQADLFVLPSILDNLPYAVMEAQIAGKPVVATQAGGIPEMVLHGETGLLSPVGDTEALYRNLQRLLDDDLLRQNLGQRAREWGQKQWSLQTMTKRILEVYDHVLQRRREG
ncbi:glycosyltransferase family 4 protein [Brevibacillus marinus]|uniref:glycosyltransferase family 4 protein n=1 Tax=Brevibacillus marinus TaxID=2496837 RepID=UPI000F82FD50|nr:glycosyltransferase family 4 protein [Brevibacillus marinus]